MSDTLCESCAYFVEEDEGCSALFDEDDLAALHGKSGGVCPYYRFYDEYKMVQKQN